MKTMLIMQSLSGRVQTLILGSSYAHSICLTNTPDHCPLIDIDRAHIRLNLFTQDRFDLRILRLRLMMNEHPVIVLITDSIHT